MTIISYCVSDSGNRLAYCHSQGTEPGILFCGGFNSNMRGNKAMFLEQVCQENGWQFTRFDYQGHGDSEGTFSQTTLHDWVQDTKTILDRVCTGHQVIVGSSMGGWIAALTAMAQPTRVRGFLGIAAAPDFTEELIWEKLDNKSKEQLQQGHPWQMPNHYDAGQPHTITMQLIDSGRHHQLLSSPVPINCKVRLLHGTGDTDVPYSLSERLLQQISSTDAQLVLVKNADHRFSSDGELKIIRTQLEALLA